MVCKQKTTFNFLIPGLVSEQKLVFSALNKGVWSSCVRSSVHMVELSPLWVIHHKANKTIYSFLLYIKNYIFWAETFFHSFKIVIPSSEFNWFDRYFIQRYFNVSKYRKLMVVVLRRSKVLPHCLTDLVTCSIDQLDTLLSGKFVDVNSTTDYALFHTYLFKASRCLFWTIRTVLSSNQMQELKR